MMLIINDSKVSQVICLGCFRRWIAARPVETRLDQLECPTCREIGLAIETGETSTAEDLLRQASEAVSQ
jgi:Zn finger protein HypA/HybF involved in hydrogenase expression